MVLNKQHKRSIGVLTFLVLALLLVSGPLAAEEYALSRGQTVYVPVYSNIYSSTKKVPIDLANTLSIRNTDPSYAIRVTAVDYYDTKGVLLKKYYKEPAALAPLESTHVFLSNRDKTGGLGANFIVKWEAEQEVNVPIIECVMSGSQGLGFVTKGQIIKARID